MSRYYNDFLEHKDPDGKWEWPNGNNSKEYNHNYYETHKAKWDKDASIAANLTNNASNYDALANGPDEPGLLDDYQRNLAKRRSKQMDDTSNRAAYDMFLDNAYSKYARQQGDNGYVSLDDPAGKKLAGIGMHHARDIYDRNAKEVTDDKIRYLSDSALAVVDTLVGSGISIIDKLFNK